MNLPYFTLNPALIWFLIGLSCVIAEFSLPGVIIVFFGAGAWVVAIITYFIDINVAAQVSIFTITSIMALILLRKKIIPASDENENSDIKDEFIGKIAVVKEPVIKGKPGRVIFKGATWKAETRSDEALEEGCRVKIVGQESILLYVEPLSEEEVKI